MLDLAKDRNHVSIVRMECYLRRKQHAIPVRVSSVSHIFSQQEFNNWKEKGWVVGDSDPIAPIVISDAPPIASSDSVSPDALPIAPSDPVSPDQSIVVDDGLPENSGLSDNGAAASYHQEKLILFLFYDLNTIKVQSKS